MPIFMKKKRLDDERVRREQGFEGWRIERERVIAASVGEKGLIDLVARANTPWMKAKMPGHGQVHDENEIEMREPLETGHNTHRNKEHKHQHFSAQKRHKPTSRTTQTKQHA